MHINIGGRKSLLALTQSEIVKKLIETSIPDTECSVTGLTTLGDDNPDRALYSFGGKSVWTKELETLLMKAVGEYPQFDLVVHSLKDVPTNLPEEFELGCITERVDPRDALIMKPNSPYKTLEDLPDGSLVGTSSIRRSAQISKKYPRLKFESVRGNLHTRLRKLDQDDHYQCIVLAAAGLIRIGLEHRITKYLDGDDMCHAVGQGALGVEIKKDNQEIKLILAKIEHLPTTYCCLAERSLMRYLEGGCSVPLGVETKFNQDTKELWIRAMVVSPEGDDSVEHDLSKIINTKDDCESLGIELGSGMLQKGAKRILDSIDYDVIAQRK